MLQLRTTLKKLHPFEDPYDQETSHINSISSGCTLHMTTDCYYRDVFVTNIIIMFNNLIILTQ